MDEPTRSLQITLQRARKARRLSQLELSLRIGVSQRHVSFVESGRAKPSRDLLMAWLAELDTPLALRNQALLQAGFAPAYGTARLADPTLAEANHALTQLLEAHDPTPALVIDADWNVLQMNRGCRWLAATLMPWVIDLAADTRLNVLDLLAHPDGFTRHMVNLHEVGPVFLATLMNEAYAQPALAPRVEAFAALLRERLGAQFLQRTRLQPATPMLTSRYATPHGELAFFSMFTTFGAPQDITLSSLRVEHMFAADAATREVLKTQVKWQGPQ